MIESSITVDPYLLPVFSLNTVIVGTGAAGFNAADRLYGYGQRDIAIVTEHLLAGTSRNTGSDKQTYYKLTLSGSEPDSVRDMAETLFSGQCVDGDLALCEAALSVQCFNRLVELGVPFPKNRYGEYIGYKTDHDPRRRATSAGPYTSRKMTECLQDSVQHKGIRIFDKMQVVRILGNDRQTFGLLCMDLDRAKETLDSFALFNCKNIIFATGGPAGMYSYSAYPHGHYGATGLAFEAGAIGRNLTEWQYGLASLHPRWNVSGTYMQSLPRMYSTDVKGEDEREFLSDFFKNRGEMLSNLFMKGYQWPFDVRKVLCGSSIIDILVYIESEKGRKVYLDYRQNSDGKEVDFQSLSSEALEYLQNAGACFGTPIQRLAHINQPAVDFYLDKGVDLSRESIEIALCAQHNNGGIAVDCWWQTNLEGFFAVGESSASHGVFRPGGSALNAGQVGSMRAAQYISAHRKGDSLDLETFRLLVEPEVKEILCFAETLLGDENNINALWDKAAERMSRIGGPIRSMDGIAQALVQVRDELASFVQIARAGSPSKMGRALHLRDMLISQEVFLCSMENYLQNGGKSRGSALYIDLAGLKTHTDFLDMFSFTLDDGCLSTLVQEVRHRKNGNDFHWRKVHCIPEEEGFFENVWRTFRENKNIF